MINTQPFLYLAIGGILLIVIVFIDSIIKDRNQNPDNIDQLNYISNLNQLINQKQQQLELLNQQYEGLQLNNSVSLPQNVVDVLDLYEQNGIKIQSDIIEDLSYLRLVSTIEIMNYIESQRNSWKLEASKKLPKGVLK